MKTSQTGLNLIESFEGLILSTYDDANDRIVKPGGAVRGVLTIGYGHTTSAGPPKVVAGLTITKQQANEILAADLGKVEADVIRLVKVPLNQNQFDALVSFHFNTGALGKASLTKKLNAGDYQGAAEGLMQWTKAAQIGPGPISGLVRRRQAEKALFLKPVEKSAPTPTGTVAGAGVAAGAVIATGAVATTATQTGWHWGYLVGGVAFLVIATWLGICWYVYEHRSVPQTKIKQTKGNK